MKIVIIKGGIGNQMFQYAFYAYLKSIGHNRTYLYLNSRKYNDHDTFSLLNSFPHIELTKGNYISKLNFSLMFFLCRIFRKYLNINLIATDETRNFAKAISRSIIFDGYWQNLFFLNNRCEYLKEKFVFSPIVDLNNLDVYSIIVSTNSISIHIRRGDYFANEQIRKVHGDISTLKYYNTAIKYITSKIANPVFFVFSDDIDWAKNNLILSKCFYINWNVKEQSYRDLQLMSHCKHNIIANSSFSWWAAWLNTNSGKTVIAPNKWVNIPNAITIEKLLPYDWIKINVE